MQERRRLPGWLKMQRASGETYSIVKHIVADNHLHTICTSGNCPNIGECWNRGTATFMILGDICTRACKFCATATGRPFPPDLTEPDRMAESIKTMNLKHCVITSVDRDDLNDGGASAWANTIKRIKEVNPGTSIEGFLDTRLPAAVSGSGVPRARRQDPAQRHDDAERRHLYG